MPAASVADIFRCGLRAWRGEAKAQGTLLPVSLEELVGADHVCRVIETFATQLDLSALEFSQAEAAAAAGRNTAGAWIDLPDLTDSEGLTRLDRPATATRPRSNPLLIEVARPRYHNFAHPLRCTSAGPLQCGLVRYEH